MNFAKDIFWYGEYLNTEHTDLHESQMSSDHYDHFRDQLFDTYLEFCRSNGYEPETY
jgi:hypothetical protein